MERSAFNKAMSAQLRAERAATDLTVQQLADQSGVNLETLKRILKNTRDINVTQVYALAEVFGITPDELVRRATERVSEASTHNVAQLHPRDMSTDQLEHLKHAANPIDVEATEPDTD